MEGINSKVQELLSIISNKPTTGQVLVSLAAALVLTLVLWISYRLANPHDTYQPKFAATLAALAIISTILMDLIQSNLALSLGMLGSLSIVRFRTNIRDPRDIGFIFWSMVIGLTASTRCYLIGGIGSAVLGIFLIVTGRRGQQLDDMMVVVRGSSTDLTSIHHVVDISCARSRVKAKNVMSDSYEVVYQVHMQQSSSDVLIRKLFALGGVDSVNLLSAQKAAV